MNDKDHINIYHYNQQLPITITGREKEARDAARASLGQPAWTVGKDAQVRFLQEKIYCCGYN